MSKENTSWGAPGGYAEVLRVAWPLIVSTGSFTLMQFVDRMFLAWHSSISIQAALPGGLLAFTLISGFMALAGYANTFVAQYHGAGNEVGCSRATAQGVWLALLSYPLILLLIPVGRWLLQISGHPPAVMAEELTFFTILMAAGLSIPLGAGISSFFTGRGDTFITMLANVAGNLVNIALDYALIFGHWGCPALGIRGAAYATAVAGFIAPAILFALYFAPRLRARYRTAATFRPDRALLARLVRFGLPSGLHLFLDVASFAVFVLLTGRMGEAALKVSNIAFSINMVAFMPLVGISIAATTLVGQYQGRRAPALAARAGWNALRIGLAYMAAVGLTYLLLPGAYFRLFGRGGEAGLSLEALLPVGRILLALMAAWGLLDAVNLVLAGALKGAGDTRFVMIYSTAMAWGLLVTGEWAIVFLFHGGILASWLWLTFYVMILSTGFWLRFRSGAWKDIEVIEPVAPPATPRPAAEAPVVVE